VLRRRGARFTGAGDLVTGRKARGESLRDSSGQPENSQAQLVRLAPCHFCKVVTRALRRAGDHSGSQGMNSRVPTMRVAPRRTMRHLEPCSRRRETALRWRKPSGWLSEKPVNVSIAGGNAVTVEGLSCYREPTRLPSLARDNLAKRVPVRNGDANGAEADGEAPHLAKCGQPLEDRTALKTASPDCRDNATCEIRGQTRSAGPTRGQKPRPSLW
jgi:hypothetical protein